MSRRVITVLFAVSLLGACGSRPLESTTGSDRPGTSAPPPDQAATAADADGSTATRPAGGGAPTDGADAAPEQAPGPAADIAGAARCTPIGPRQTQAVETGQHPVGDDLSPTVKRPVLALRGIQLCAGQPHLFVGSHTATVSVNMLWGTDIRCTPTGADPGDARQQSLRRSVLSTRNHGGSGQQHLGVRWLFTPDRSGTYDCELRSWGKTPRGVSGTMTVVPGASTVLGVSGVEAGATEWRQSDDVYLCNDTPDDPGCNRSGTVLRREVTADGAARSIDVYAGVEASICANGYSECTAGTAGMGDFTIRTRLVATQVVGPGSSTVCPGAQAHVEDVTTPVPGAGRLNHTKVQVEMDAPVPVIARPGCSRTFVIRVLVDYVRTNAQQPNHGGLVEGMIPDGTASNPEALNRAYTSAYVLSNR